MMIRLSTLLLLPFFVVGQEDFQCGVPELAEEMNVDKDFDTIAPQGDCQSNGGFLVPKTIHWHIYAIPDGEVPRLSMFPEDLVEPYVSGGSLKFDFQEHALQGLSKGDRIKTAVNLYIPVSQLKKISISGVNQNIEVINDNPSFELESITIKDSGVDNRLYVTSPYSKVHYKGSGVDSSVQVEAASGSSIDISGVDQDVWIKTGEGLNVKMSGVDQKVYIEGGYEKIKMSGVDNTAYVNGENRCNNIERSPGLDNDCSTTEATVVVEALSCLASTKVGEYGCNFGDNSTGAAIAVGAVLLVLLILLCIACCCGVKVCVSGQAPVAAKNTETKTEYDQAVVSTGVVEAEVIEVKAGQVTPMEGKNDIEDARQETVPAKMF
jgi:hypothetical protein